MRSFAGVLFVVCEVAQGGAITSANLSFGDYGTSASFQGVDFQTSISDFDSDPGPDGGFAPFTPSMPNGTFGGGYGSSGYGSSVTYNGTYYTPLFMNVPTGLPYADSVSYSVYSYGAPTITGPGVYPVSASVQVNFCLSDPTGSIPNYYCESDAGTAAGAFYATSCGCGTSWLFVSSLSLRISTPTITATPEPSSLPCVCVGILVAISGKRWLKNGAGDGNRTRDQQLGRL